MIDKGLKLFDRDYVNNKFKFMKLFDLLVSNKSSSRGESLFLIAISCFQLLSGFFNNELKVYQYTDNGVDPYFCNFHDVIRIKNLLITDANIFILVTYLISLLFIIMTIYFIYLQRRVTKTSRYSFNEAILNLIFKYYFYVFFVPILDISLSITCIGNPESDLCYVDPSKTIITTDLSGNIVINDGKKVTGILIVLSVFNFLYSIFVAILLAYYYNDSLMYSNSVFARKNCNYEVYYVLNAVVFALILSLSNTLGPLIFLIYNLIVSMLFAKFFHDKYPFYDDITNLIIGCFHLIYVWTNIFGIFYYFIYSNQIAICYLIGCVVVIIMTVCLKSKIEERIVLDTPYHKINNQFHFLFYVKNLLNKINTMDKSLHAKAEIIGIIQVHILECPSLDCPIKKVNNKYYLPITTEWSNPKLGICDKVYLLNFLSFVMQFFTLQNSFSADILINFAMFYLESLGNMCQSIFIYKKVSDLKLSQQESFAYFRLNNIISKALIEKLKPSNEVCKDLEDLNPSMFYKYEDLSEKFFEEMNRDITYNLEFWKILKDFHEKNIELDFNKIFNLTDKIRLSKEKIERTWNNLFQTYNGFNYLFDLYEHYTEHVNDDFILIRELEWMKTKLAINYNHHQNNIYDILFSKETGMIICHGEKGKEGLIEEVNDVTEQLFEYNKEELKGVNIKLLMPKMFEKQHKGFMERYTTIGEKRIIDKSFLTYAKTKKNNILAVSLRIKTFPILTDSLFFCGMITKEQVEDVILLDQKFNIQGMSKKLMDRFKLNDCLFQDCEVPIYLICKQFIRHYRNNMSTQKKDAAVLTTNNMTGNYEFMKLFQKEKDINHFVKKEEPKEFHQINASIEIDETCDEIFEIKFPNILKSYSPMKMNKASLIDFRMFKEDSGSDYLEEITEEPVHLGETSQTDFIEGDNTTNDDKYKYDKLNQYNQEPDKEFQGKINYYKQIFEKQSFTILEREIEPLNFESKEGDEFKCNVIFKEYKYSTYTGYILRCIEKKDDQDWNSQSDGSHGVKDPDRDIILSNQNKIIKSFKHMKQSFECHKDDITKLSANSSKYYNLMQEDETFFNLIMQYKQDILAYSRIFSMNKHDDIILEETASQVGLGYSDDLSKKNKIEEIKSNLMKDIQDFHTLRWIKSIYYTLLFGTVLFSILYILNFQDLYQNTLNVNELSLILSNTTMNLSTMIGSLLSLSAIYKLGNVNYNSYITDPYLYFDSLKNNSMQNYDYVLTNFDIIYYTIKKYIAEDNPLFTDQIKMTLSTNSLFNDVAFMFELRQSLIHTNNLLNFNQFNLNSANITQDNLNLITYYSKLSIEDLYNFGLPYLLDKLTYIDDLLNVYKNSKLGFQIYLLLAFTVFLIMLLFLYFVSICMTSGYMQKELMKVSKIRLKYINETIRNLDYFYNRILSKYKETNKTITTHNKEPLTTEPTNKGKDGELDKTIQTIIDDNYMSKESKFKNLQVLNKFYFSNFFLLLFSCIILALVYVQSSTMIENAEKFYYLKNYFFFSMIKASTDLVDTKCTLLSCKRQKLIGFNKSFTYEDDTIIKEQLNFYPELFNLYTNKYLKDICALIHNDTVSTSYLDCSNDDIILSTNSTLVLLNTLNDALYYINKEYSIDKTAQFNNTYFEKAERIFYDFIINIPRNLINTSVISLNNYMYKIQFIVVSLIVIFAVVIITFSIYAIFSYIASLIDYIAISRCILKIIPTNVIIHTNELEEWLENKY
jgi:PAS domain S-box-containing protein